MYLREDPARYSLHGVCSCRSPLEVPQIANCPSIDACTIDPTIDNLSPTGRFQASSF